MKFFPTLRTRRLTVQLKELSIGDDIALATMPEHLEQAECTAFLRYAIAEVKNGPQDPANWTIPERNLAVAHYLASVLEDGPDFALSDVSKYSDYLDSGVDISLSSFLFAVGEIGGEQWSIQHLTGAMAESIERLQGIIEGITHQTHWRFGAMAAQLVNASDEQPEFTGDGQFDEWLLHRMRVFMAFPSSDFEQLMAAYYLGFDKLHHLFAYDFSLDGGIVILPRKGGASDLPPARFPVSSCVSKIAASMAGKPNRSSVKP
ncbi:MAG: hypothetical protein ACXWT0_00305 [Methylobacter sp.]